MADNINGVDLLIMLDGGGFGRFSNQPEKLRKFPGKSINIDHHSSPPDKFDLFMLCPQLLSSCQIIYESFYKTADIPKPIAEALLLGLLGDTGNFSYLGPSDLGAFDMGKRLIDILQIQIQEFVARYSLISPRIFKLISELIVNTKLEKVEGWDGYSWTHLRRELERGSYSDNEFSEAARIYMDCFLRVVEGAPWGFVIMPKSDGGCSVSLRSLPGSVNVRKVVEDMKIGGGHDRAAGSTFKPQGNEKVDPISSYEKIKDWMSKNNQPAS